jgi:hypothetical protein
MEKRVVMILNSKGLPGVKRDFQNYSIFLRVSMVGIGKIVNLLFLTMYVRIN